MAAPTIVSITQTSEGTDQSTITVDLPTTVDAGDLLLLAVMFEREQVSAAITPPTGWTELLDVEANASQGHLYICAISAVGNEDGGNVNIVGDLAGKAAAQVYRITGWGGTVADDIDITSINTLGVTSTPNPPSVTAGWGAADNLVVVFTGLRDDNPSLSADIYGNGLLTSGGGEGNDNATLISDYTTTTSATEDPGAWSLSESETCIAATLIIEPAAAASGAYTSILLTGVGA